MKNINIIKITTAILSFFSLNSMAVNIDESGYEKTILSACPEQSISLSIRTDPYSFLDENDGFFDNLKIDLIENRASKDYNLNVYGELLVYKNESTQYVFIKTMDLSTNDFKWINTDVLTGDPFKKELELLKNVEKDICGIKQ